MDHIRGDTFDYVAILPDTIPDGDFADFVPTCQLRDRQGRLICEVEAAWVDPVTTRTISLHYSGSTQDWALGLTVYDIQFRRPSDNYVKSTRKGTFNIVEDVTR